MPNELNATYERIAGQISSPEPQCVLVLGPELSVNEAGQSYRQYFRKMMVGAKSSYLDGDNLFYFHDGLDEDKIKNEIIKYYQSVGDQALLEMISRLPIPLVINVCPDKSLNKLFQEKKLNFEEGYFSINSKAKFNNLPEPSRDKPVLYNILGSIDWDPSMILTHSRLYETMEYLLPEKSLPDNIERFITDSATSFIFLGFHFESWYYQLICHKLLGKQFNKRPIKLSTPHFKKEDNVSIIMGGTFGMRFTNDSPSEFLQEITRLMEENYPGALREKSERGFYSAFVSYARNNNSATEGAESGEHLPEEPGLKREVFVDVMEQYFAERKQNSLIQFFRDRQDIRFGDSIDSFMHRIGAGKTVILVVSDKYLRSYYCMMEAMRTFRHKDTSKRIFIVLLEDVDTSNKQQYKDYWHTECKRLLEDNAGLEGGRYEDFGNIYRFLDIFFNALADIVHLKLYYRDFENIPPVPVTNSGVAEPPITLSKALLRICEQRREEVQQFLDTVIQKMEQ